VPPGATAAGNATLETPQWSFDHEPSRCPDAGDHVVVPELRIVTDTGYGRAIAIEEGIDCAATVASFTGHNGVKETVSDHCDVVVVESRMLFTFA
jgi:hypothetical protein